MAMDISSVFSLLSSIFRIPSAWFGFPAFITNILIPFILMTYAFYKLLQKLHIFGYHTGIYMILAVIMGLVLLPVGPLAAIAAAGFIGMFALTTWKSRILFIVILIVVYLFVLPFLATIRF
jgi:hypothetical protein